MSRFLPRGKRQSSKIDLDRALQPRSCIARQQKLYTYKTELPRADRMDTWCVCSIFTGGIEDRKGVVINTSDTGARVRFDTRGRLPIVVKIKAPRIGLEQKARVVWQDSMDVGLEYI